MQIAALLMASVAVSQVVPVAYAQNSAYDYDTEQLSPAQWIAGDLGTVIGLAAACGEEASSLQNRSVTFLHQNARDEDDLKSAYAQLDQQRQKSFKMQQDSSMAVSCTEASHQIDMAYRMIDYTEQTLKADKPKVAKESPLNYIAQLGDQAADAYAKGYRIQSSGDLNGEEEVTLKLIPSKDAEPDQPIEIAPNSKRRKLDAGLPEVGTAAQPSYIRKPVTSSYQSARQVNGSIPGFDTPVSPNVQPSHQLPGAFKDSGAPLAPNSFGGSKTTTYQGETRIDPYTGRVFPVENGKIKTDSPYGGAGNSSGSSKKPSHFNSLYP